MNKTFLLVSALVAQSAFANKTLVFSEVLFDAKSNLSAVSVQGKSENQKGILEADGKTFKAIKAEIPIDTIKTGIELRDRHMRERIFQKDDKSQPALTFESNQIQWTSATEFQLEGTLSVRGTTKPVRFNCSGNPEFKENPNALTSGQCSADIKLSDYGIERPGHLGVKMEDAVKVSLKVSGS